MRGMAARSPCPLLGRERSQRRSTFSDQLPRGRSSRAPAKRRQRSIDARSEMPSSLSAVSLSRFLRFLPAPPLTCRLVGLGRCRDWYWFIALLVRATSYQMRGRRLAVAVEIDAKDHFSGPSANVGGATVKLRKRFAAVQAGLKGLGNSSASTGAPMRSTRAPPPCARRCERRPRRRRSWRTLSSAPWKRAHGSDRRTTGSGRGCDSCAKSCARP